VKSQQENQDFEGTAEHAEDETVADETTAAGTKVDEADDAGGRAVETDVDVADGAGKKGQERWKKGGWS
jgi:hypothetical protein